MSAKAKRRSVKQHSPAPSQSIAPGTRRILVTLALLFITLLAYSDSFHAGFTLDNKGILRDPRVTQATSQNMDQILHRSYWWPSGESGLYRPVTTFSYLFNYAVLGNQDQPAGYHWFNFLLHAANVVLVYFLMLRLTGQFWMSAVIAAIWAVHPVLTESVTNIVGRSDLLAALATLSGFLMYLKSREAAGWRRGAWLLGLMAVTAVGVFSKESAVCVLGVILLYEVTWWKERKRPKALLFGCIAVVVPIAAMLYQRSTVLAAALPAEFPFTDNPIVGASFWSGRLTAMGVIARYLWLLVWPAKLSCDYSYPQIPLARGTFQDWLAWVAVLCVVVIVALLYRRNRTAFFLACFAAVTFVPMSNLLFPIGTIMAERFLYLPSIGVLACLVMGIYASSRRAELARRTLPLVLCVVVAALGIRTWARNSDWQDDLSITASSLETSPNSFKLHRQMAELLFGAARTPDNIERGKHEAETSMALLDPLPDSLKIADAYCLAGGYFLIEGDMLSRQDSDGRIIISPTGNEQYQKAIQILQRCAAIDKSVRAAYVQKLDSARSPRDNALTPASGDPQPYLMLSVVYRRLSDADKAAEVADQALRLHPRNPAAYRQIADVFLLKNRKEDAARALTEGMLLTSDPGLTGALAELYQNGLDSKTCAPTPTAGGQIISARCEPARQRICAVAPEIIQARLQSGRSDLAEQQRRTFLEDYGCSAASLDQLLHPRGHS